jgi:circadian clock protein KaiB
VSSPSVSGGAVPGRDGQWHLTLYIAGQSTKSKNACINLTRICEEHLHGNYSIETIDLAKHPSRARSDDIFVIPTLIRQLPAPVRKCIGDLSDGDRVVVELNLPTSL